eukprot:CAMPEP_0171789994 /NCGR_PEP_ID=MMETSP0991-20121206/65462_1 /TAXON_ID=483369 /ORGANISM="non described non described, Strain CCMP2098" /LENGTH=69 /DNA_ID=CAMNT_0012399513 /DNA_START=1 /DNA_END=207 /DNA_ORIENTATION=+
MALTLGANSRRLLLPRSRGSSATIKAFSKKASAMSSEDAPDVDTSELLKRIAELEAASAEAEADVKKAE